MPANEPDAHLEAGDLEVLVRPSFGGQIASLRWRDRELLDPGSRRGSTAVDQADYLSGGLGGIDDCLPAIAPGAHPTHGVSIPDHGELWYRPAEVLDRGADRIVLRAVGEHLPFTLRRTLTIADGELRVDYRIEHTAAGELPLVWAAHPLLAVSPGMRIQIPGESRPDDWESLPEGSCAKLFKPWGGPVSVTHPAWGLELSVALEAELPAHLGLWLNRGGYPSSSPAHHIAIEPTFGNSDELDASMASGSCLILGPHEGAEWAVVYSVSPA
jgi:galactose mutarotase-like enzyme